MDDDFVPQDYRLQYRKSTASHFEDVYVGSETEFIVLHIDPNVDYQFRVCARGDGRQEWSPWSVPQTGRTSLVPHGILSLLLICCLCHWCSTPGGLWLAYGCTSCTILGFPSLRFMSVTCGELSVLSSWRLFCS